MDWLFNNIKELLILLSVIMVSGSCKHMTKLKKIDADKANMAKPCFKSRQWVYVWSLYQSF